MKCKHYRIEEISGVPSDNIHFVCRFCRAPITDKQVKNNYKNYQWVKISSYTGVMTKRNRK
jgi:hypothetical protein